MDLEETEEQIAFLDHERGLLIDRVSNLEVALSAIMSPKSDKKDIKAIMSNLFQNSSGLGGFKRTVFVGKIFK
ncbi:MAG: hypothetical protein DRH08_01870 [Deltaproteobacteria bacterium]|nr:MAG: hypothetical protein DRH08_01870 [Deltaproteobacteria bacterium]